MAIITGRVVFDRDRSATISSGDSGLANIPVVLQNMDTAARLTVLTDADGKYTFLNVPNGSYRIVEAYGTPGGVLTPGDFSTAAPGSVPQGSNPPISVAINPVSYTHLVAIFFGYAVFKEEARQMAMAQPVGEQTVLVCVTGQRRCERLIRQGRIVAEHLQARLRVVSVQPKDALDAQAADALEYLFTVAKEQQAEMSVYYTNEPMGTLVHFARRCQAVCLVAGCPGGAGESRFLADIRQHLPLSLIHI